MAALANEYTIWPQNFSVVPVLLKIFNYKDLAYKVIFLKVFVSFLFIFSFKVFSNLAYDLFFDQWPIKEGVYFSELLGVA